jgi:hypothetical protein
MRNRLADTRSRHLHNESVPFLADQADVGVLAALCHAFAPSGREEDLLAHCSVLSVRRRRPSTPPGRLCL